MKRTIITLTVLLLITIGLSAKNSILWFSAEHDFGAFKEDSGLVTCQFKGINVANESISIVNARATCGCTTPEYSYSPFNPGDTITITVSYDPEGRPGRFMKKVYLRNSIDDEQTELKIRGVVIGSEETLKSRYPIIRGKLRLQRDMVAMGELLRGRAKAEFISVYNQTTDTIEPKLTHVPKYIKSTITPTVIPPGEQASVSFHFDAFYCEEWGLVNDSVVMISDTHGGEEIGFEVSANIVPDFSKLTPGERMNAPVVEIENSRIDFGRVNRNEESITKEFQIKNNGKNPLKIFRVYSPDAGVEVFAEKDKLKGGKSAKIKVKVTPSQLKGELLNARVVMVVNDPNNSQPVVRVVGELK